MGYLMIVSPPVPHALGDKMQLTEIDTVSCCHCQAVIRVTWKNTPAAQAQPKRMCSRCRKPICKYCDTVRHGVCSPVDLKIENALKNKGWNADLAWEQTSFPVS